MESHCKLASLGYLNLHSYGTGTKVRLPGESINRPNIYEFDKHSYEFIAADLRAKNEAKYRQNGILPMIERDLTVKRGPERWQNQNFSQLHMDIVLTFERRVFEAVIQDYEVRLGNRARQAASHVINVETTDNHSEAANSAKLVEILINKICSHENWQERLCDVIEEFELETGKTLEHQIIFN
jgi:RNA polymerase II subunit A C-terminal domain phosphatase SSU72